MAFPSAALRCAVLWAGTILLSASPAAAQADVPPGWLVRPDAPAAVGSAVRFDLMAPGWHITTGPAALLYDPQESAAGRFAVDAELILFPNTAANGEYGVFVGGAGLAGEGAAWTALLVRADGSAAVVRQAHGTLSLLLPWTAHQAVKGKSEGGTVTNVVSVQAEPDSVRFMVNGERIGVLARAGLELDGNFGFRIGDGVNLHITNLDVKRRLAPFPRR